MSVNIKISGDTADAVCRDSLKFHIRMISRDVSKIERQKKITKIDQTILVNQRAILSSLNTVYDYYGADD